MSHLKTVRQFLTEEDGMGTVEVILIIVVLVGLVVIFKEKITDIVNSILPRSRIRPRKYKVHYLYERKRIYDGVSCTYAGSTDLTVPCTDGRLQVRRDPSGDRMRHGYRNGQSAGRVSSGTVPAV